MENWNHLYDPRALEQLAQKAKRKESLEITNDTLWLVSLPTIERYNGGEKKLQDPLPPNDKIIVVVPTPDGGFFTSEGAHHKNDFVTEAWLTRLEKAEDKQARLKKHALKQVKPLSQAKNYQK